MRKAPDTLHCREPFLCFFRENRRELAGPQEWREETERQWTHARVVSSGIGRKLFNWAGYDRGVFFNCSLIESDLSVNALLYTGIFYARSFIVMFFRSIQ